ncbi:sigma-70 family RNA polymerase sigma factor [Streptomyces sp. 8K308]|uniref:RNA polymerase sigma factor n=1 Tax=Streptomyces sp. 8K308 TaxID=2530388 RepID=UPI001048960D|nr:sigma-70 family RNA polymerase sigma factor [Streptomyces sp. 8K308]TDC20597.1 sigma-70 family RNA polymerase sigma factor [Streptomyces sp. 8K308]
MRGTTQDQSLPDTAVVAAARSGDRRALDELVRGYLPLVYNVVGRALNGHPDVDDVVQETLLRATRHIADLRDPTRFRSWLVAIAVHQVRDHRRTAAGNEAPLQPEAVEAADPRGDFVDLTILRLGLSGQRRETAEATRWLDAEERALLSLWWQEAAGALNRGELAEAAGVSVAHAGVRVQRLKNRLDTARRVVRALAARPRCPGLAEVVAGWDGSPSALWRKRVARHVHTCSRCAEHAAGLAPAEGLLAGLALVPLPVGYLVSARLLATVGAGAAADTTAGLTGLLTLKHAALAAASVTVVAAGIGGYALQRSADPEPPAAAPPAVAADPTPGSPSPTGEPRSSRPRPPPSLPPRRASSTARRSTPRSRRRTRARAPTHCRNGPSPPPWPPRTAGTGTPRAAAI